MQRVLALYQAAGLDDTVLSIEFEGSGDQKVGVERTRDLLQRYLEPAISAARSRTWCDCRSRGR
jgi:hypothetical protein